MSTTERLGHQIDLEIELKLKTAARLLSLWHGVVACVSFGASAAVVLNQREPQPWYLPHGSRS